MGDTNPTGDTNPKKPRRDVPIAQSRQRTKSPQPRSPQQLPQRGPRPSHPSGAATLLIIGVTLLIFLIAALSTFSGGR